MNAADVTVIVPQFNHVELTIACVRSFRESHGEDVPLLVIDDGSSTTELQRFHDASLHCKLVEQRHLGVTAAWNLGAHLAAAELLVFLNNDTVTRGPWLDRLLAPLRSGRALMTGVGWRREPHLPRPFTAARPAPLLLQGWCFAISRTTLHALGGFHPDLKTYFSDTDLQLRLLLLQSGVEDPLQAVPGLPLHHLGHATAHQLPPSQRGWHADRELFRQLWK